MRDMSPHEFAHAARSLAQLVRHHGLVVPGFRSPPRDPKLTRCSIRRPDGSIAVAVAIRGREFEDVVNDMIDGVLFANDLTGSAASGWRLALQLSLAEELQDSGTVNLAPTRVLANYANRSEHMSSHLNFHSPPQQEQSRVA